MHHRLFTLFQALPVVLGLGTAGCSSKIYVNLAPEIATSVKSTRVTSYIHQEELKVQFFETGSGGGSLIGLAVSAGINYAGRVKAEGAAKRVTGATKDVDFRGQFWAAISPVVKETPWLKAGEPKTSTESFKLMTATRVAGAAALVINTDYSLSQNCRAFVASSGLRFYLQGQPETEAAANYVSYQSADIGPQEGDEAISLWSANNGATYQKAVAESVLENAKMIRYALRLMGGEPPRSLRQVTIILGRPLDGSIIEETEERIVFQDSVSGSFFSFPAKGLKFVEPGPPIAAAAAAPRI